MLRYTCLCVCNKHMLCLVYGLVYDFSAPTRAICLATEIKNIDCY